VWDVDWFVVGDGIQGSSCGGGGNAAWDSQV
jgi:hypothetical protein